jgi:hypothetical protein
MTNPTAALTGVESVLFAMTTAPSLFGFDNDRWERAADALVRLTVRDEVATTDALNAALTLGKGVCRQMLASLRDKGLVSE